MTSEDPWKQRFDRERAARREAEALLHEKSREIYAANQALEARATELAASLEQLRDAQDRLIQQEKLVALGGLVAGVAHEINTPVGVAVTAVSLAADRLRDVESAMTAGTLTRGGMRAFVEEMNEAVALALANLERAADLVQSFKKVAVDQSSESLRETTLEELVGDVVASVRPLMRRSGVELAVDLGAHDALPAQVRIDAGAFVQVLTNLLQNACVHAFDDAAPSKRLALSLACEAAAAVVVIADNGRGMSAEVVQRVYEPFFTTRRSSGGSGLGMHITHSLVTQRFEGTIDLDTAPGAGTRWTIRLPWGSSALAVKEGARHASA